MVKLRSQNKNVNMNCKLLMVKEMKQDEGESGWVTTWNNSCLWCWPEACRPELTSLFLLLLKNIVRMFAAGSWSLITDWLTYATVENIRIIKWKRERSYSTKGKMKRRWREEEEASFCRWREQVRHRKTGTEGGVSSCFVVELEMYNVKDKVWKTWFKDKASKPASKREIPIHVETDFSLSLLKLSWRQNECNNNIAGLSFKLDLCIHPFHL